MATTRNSGTTNGVARATRKPWTTCETAPSASRTTTGVIWRRIVEISSAEIANVSPFTTKAAVAVVTASRTAPKAGPSDEPEVLHGVQQRVRRAEARLADQPREQGHRGRTLGRARRGGEGGECDDEDHRPVERHDGGQGEHLHAPKQVADEQHRAAVVAVGNRATHRTEQRIGKQPKDRRRADPPRRAGRAVHVAEERRVVEPVAELRRRAGGDERSDVTNRKDAAIRIRRARLHGENLARHGTSRSARELWIVDAPASGSAQAIAYGHGGGGGSGACRMAERVGPSGSVRQHVAQSAH